MTIPLSERIATQALDTFARLPPRCKPRTLADGRREWTPLSAIALSHSEEPDGVRIVSLATGTKSLPVSALPKCYGLVLHDCHAEILALRGFNCWLLTEIRRLLDSPSYTSKWLELVSRLDHSDTHAQVAKSPPFRLREGVEISLFSTEAPCGDASMELLMSATEAAGRDITPWSISTAKQDYNEVKLPPGRGSFSNLGALRRKPARADAEISMSKSCTDKLMLKQFTSLLCFPVDLLVALTEEVYLRRMIVYEDRWNEEGYSRAFGASGRLAKVVPVIPAAHSGAVHQPKFFEINALPQRFRRFNFENATGGQNEQKSRASNICALWIAEYDQGRSGHNAGTVEVLLNGVKQGFKQFDDRERKGSVACKRNMVQEVSKLVSRLAEEHISPVSVQDRAELSSTSYLEFKARSSHAWRTVLKQDLLDKLGGWPQKAYQDDFIIPSQSLLA